VDAVSPVLRGRKGPPPLLFDHQHQARRELDDAVRPAADHAFVNRRMARRADDEQIGLDLGRQSDDVANRVSGQDMGSSSTWLSAAIL
jgi:hypothetical protein